MPELTYEQMRTNAERIVDAALKERVERGIEALNAAVERGDLDADWPSRIDPAHLLMQSKTQCVLGQTFEEIEPTEEQWAVYREHRHEYGGAYGYEKGLAVLDGEALVFPEDFGFDLACGSSYGSSYEALRRAWLTVLDADD